MFGTPSLGSFQQAGPAMAQAFSAAALPPQPTESKQPVEVKPAPPPQPSVPAVQKPPPQPSAAETAQAQEAYAAAKAEQERLKAVKANQELKNMLVKEVNDFQMELYKFMVKTRDTQAKLQQDIDAINLNFPMQGMDAEQLRKECSLDELRGAIVQLKLELVRACAVVAEARTHAEAKDSHQWTQADPLTTKRVASIKKLAYYVQNQVDQAYKALDYKWNQMVLKDPKNFKPGQRMIRPVLDDVYQPLVKQQEILCRQEAVLRTLKNTLKEVDSGPMFKSTSLLRSTPFKNKDPLSKLTKNILNMSIEPQTKPKEPLLSAQKLEALRDMLANHKTIKVKPVNVELRQQLAAMRISYEKSMQEKAAQMKEKEFLKAQAQLKDQQEIMMAQAQLKQQEMLRAEAQFKLQQQMKEEMMKHYVPPKQYAPPDIVKIEPKVEVTEQPAIAVPSFTPVANNVKPSPPAMNNVVRTLFTEKPEPAKPVEAPKPLPTQGLFASKPPSFSTPQQQSLSASPNTRSVLKDLLQNKQANAAAKNDANTFMGQKICSPVAFSFGSSTATADAPTSEPPSYFTTKPPARVLDTKSIFSQAQGKHSQTNLNVKSSETGEEEGAANKTIELKKEDKPITNMFGSKSSLLSNLNKPTEPKAQEAPKVENKAPIKVILKAAEKAKENIPEKVAESVLQEPQKIEKKEPEVKPLGQQGFNLGSAPAATPIVTSTSEPQKPSEPKTETTPETPKVEEKAVAPTPTPVSPSASSLFASANASSPTTIKPQPLFGSTSPAATPTETVITPPSSAAESSETAEKPSVFASAAASSASSLFSTAVASQASKTTQSGSIFSTSKPSGVFASSQGSIFGSAATTTTSSVFGTSTAASVFGSEAKPSVFSTPTPATAAFGATSTTQSVFASTPSVFAQATSTPSSVFASAAPGSIFGTATTQASVFGTSTSTTSVFGGASTTTQASVFATPATTAQSLFGTAATSQASVFGSPASTTQSVFGTGTATTQASVFGGSTQSVFGSTPSTQSSIFGSPSGQPSVFGSAPATQASVFGTAPATTAQSGGSLFGGAESNLFAAASISTTSAPSQSTGGSIFGGSPTGSVFGGGGTNVFGGKASFSQSNPTAASIFGGGAAFGQKQPQANNFWSGGANNTTSTGFGSGFGQQASTQASSIFGSSTGGSFSTPSPAGQAFGSPQQAPAFGATDNKPSVFGSPQQQSAPAFGGSPVFGSQPVFGQSSGFGSPTSGGFGGFGGFNKSPSSGFGAPAAFGGGATFGGAPAFGSTSPGKMFGGSPGPAFGSPTQSNATFESLATQNTLTFGNLAQQSGQQPVPAAPSFNASPAFTGWRG
ncbi:hypothetical protein ABMA28_015017 [Loxostege sticticalis]|uniref:Nuclear pore complex protein Nup214 phenylalanine-glycine (FG) domain-containing protein n=2 Tax=Loxostege sticticalis TaxID=481309 RepID=A0ABD0TE15_LOXSC